MNLQYHQFGQGLCARGNTRPSIKTAGISYNTGSMGIFNDLTGPKKSVAYGASYSPGDLSKLHFMMVKDAKRPSFPVAYGLNTEQLAFRNARHPGGNAGGYGAGMTGTHGSAGFYDNVRKYAKMVLNKQTGGMMVGQNGHGIRKMVGMDGHGIRKTGGIMVGQNGHGIRKLIGGHPGVWDPQAKGMVESGHGVKFPTGGFSLNNLLKKSKVPSVMNKTGGMYKRKGKKKSKKSKGSKKSRKTGGNYLDIRNAINKISSAGFYKKKKRSSKRTTRRKH